MERRRPRPETPLLAAPPQSWLELFYDLVFVAAVLVLSSTYSRDASLTHVAWLVLVFAMVWSAWLATTLLTNRVRLAGTTLRSLLVAQMVLVLGLVLTADDHLADNTAWTGPLFAAVLVVLAAMYHLVRRDHPELRPALRHAGARVLAAALLFALSPLVDADWYALVWLAGIVLVLVPARAEGPPVDSHHLTHRFGELTMVIIGETFVKVGLVASEERLGDLDLWVLPMAFVLMFSIWWLYFTDVPATGIPAGRERSIAWALLHLPLHLAVVALAVGVAKLLTAHTASHGQGPGGIRFVALPLLVVGLSMVALNLLPSRAANRRRAAIHAGGVVVMAAVVAVGALVDDLASEPIAVALTVVMVGTAVATRRYALVPDAERRGDEGVSRGG